MSTETTETTETPETSEATEERTPFTELEELVAAAKVDWLKLRNKGVQVSATKFRKKMQEVRALAKTLRVEALDLRKEAKAAAVERKAQASS